MSAPNGTSVLGLSSDQMGGTEKRPASSAGKKTTADPSAARWFDWQAQTERPRSAGGTRSGGNVTARELALRQAAAAQSAAEAQVHPYLLALLESTSTD